jgi:hypothetical protein
VQPLGARLAAGAPDRRAPGLGRLACLDDALVLQLLVHLDARSLVALSAASRAAYCYANHEDVWRTLVVQARLWLQHLRCYILSRSGSSRILDKPAAHSGMEGYAATMWAGSACSCHKRSFM